MTLDRPSLRENFEKQLSPAGLLSIWSVLKNLTDSSNIYSIDIPYTKSLIVQRNCGVVYCAMYGSLKGLFRKGTKYEATTLFGKIVCDEIKLELGNKGFFTTDELPAYGLSGHEKRLISKRSVTNNEDLVIIFVYKEIEAKRTNALLHELLTVSKIEIQHLINPAL